MLCKICGNLHSHDEAACKEQAERGIQRKLAATFQELLDKHGDTNAVRLIIANYAIGYTGAAFGLHIPQ